MVLARHTLILCISASAATFLGCTASTPHVETESAATQAVALPEGQRIEFRVNGDPIDADGSIPFTLNPVDVVRISVQVQPEVQSALAAVRVAQAEARQAQLFPNPIVSVAFRYPEGGGKPVIDAGLTADLLAVLRRPKQVDAANARLRASSAEAITTVLETVSTALEHYYTVQSLEASLRVLRERSELLKRLKGLSESRLKAGEGTRLDIVTFETQSVELEVEIADQEAELRDQRLTLARLLGKPNSDADWVIPTWTAPAAPEVSESQSVTAALKARPEIQQRAWELAALGVERGLTGLGLFEGMEAGIDAERDGDWSVGPAVAVPLPLLDVGQARRERADAAVVQARHQLTASRRQVIEDVRRAYATLRSANANLSRVQLQLMPLQQQRLQQAESQFRGGQTDITALLLAEQDLRQSQTQMIDLQRRVALARVRLERAVGGAGVLLSEAAHPSTQPGSTQPNSKE